MGELKMEGLLSQIFKGTPLAGIGITPQLVQNEIKIEITEQQFKELIFKGLDERGKKAVNIKLENGKLIVTIKLF